MNLALRQAVLLVFSLILLGAPIAEGAGKSAISDCSEVGRKVRASVVKSPASLLPIVRKTLAANEDCACEIVRAAILAVESDPDLIREIVITALETLESRAAEIAECAVLAAPGSVVAVKSALYSVLGGPPTDSDVPTSIGNPTSVHGIFLVPPETASPSNPGP